MLVGKRSARLQHVTNGWYSLFEDESDKSVIEWWVENPYWQLFCGFHEMQHECPIDPSSLSRWRKRVGADRLEKMLEVTLQAAIQLKAIKPMELTQVNVDSTVQEKSIAFPTNARLYHKMRVTLVRQAQRMGYPLTTKPSFRWQVFAVSTELTTPKFCNSLSARIGVK